MRHQITISSHAKMMLVAIRDSIGTQDLSHSAIAEMCIQSAFENLKEGQCFHENLNPTQEKLDEILRLLRENLAEF